jgi:four helix bundle protein
MESSLLKLEVYDLAHKLAVRLHRMSLTHPSIERFEEAQQIRRSSKRVSASIVEGHTLRKRKGLYLSYLHRGLASLDETQEHLLLLRDCGSLATPAFKPLFESSEELSRRLFRFIQVIEKDYEFPNYLENLSLQALESVQVEEDPQG